MYMGSICIPIHTQHIYIYTCIYIYVHFPLYISIIYTYMSNNYTRAIRAVASENVPQLVPGEAAPTNNANSIEAPRANNIVVFTLN